MSDVARADADPDRRVEGRISLDVLDVPDAPAAPVPGNSVVSRQVSLTWGEPDANGAPIDYYEVRASGGPTRRCAATACEIGGLTNGRAYTFQVRAHNAVGFSDWSGSSRPATPDEKPGLVGPIRNTRVADRTLVIAWNPPATTTSTIDYYVVTYGGTSRKTSRPEATITGLDNNIKYSFKVYAVNDVGRGPVRTSRTFQSQGPVGIPGAPTVEDTPTSSSAATVAISWAAVPPNGPGPVNYRVLRNGEPVPGCDTQQTSCSIPSVTYDGGRNEFRVGASVGRELPQFGPAKDWYAVGRPDPWGAWTVEPTGRDGEARVGFTVPAVPGHRLDRGDHRRRQRRAGVRGHAGSRTRSSRSAATAARTTWRCGCATSSAAAPTRPRSRCRPTGRSPAPRSSPSAPSRAAPPCAGS